MHGVPACKVVFFLQNGSNGNTQITERQKRYKKKMQLKKARQRFFLVSFICILILAGIITLLINSVSNGGAQNNTQAQSNSQTSQTTSGVTSQANTGQSNATGVSQSTSTSLAQTAQISAASPQQAQQNTFTLPTASTMALPVNGSAPLTYYDNVLIVGDSLVQSMQLFEQQAGNAQFAAYYNSTPENIVSGDVTNASGKRVNAIDEIVSFAKNNVYIAFGTDALDNLENEEFVESYDEFLTALKEKMPIETEYYLVNIAPVSASKSSSDTNYANTRIQTLNNEIAQLAYKHDMNYISMYEILSDENGNLKQEYLSGTGGVKINSAACNAIYGHILTHTSYTSSGKL